ncbi:MAG: hypothetical protein RLZ44_1746 [Pseudomonadota bacterium]
MWAALPVSAIPAATEPRNADARWQLIDAVQQHLFPSEPEAPGARELKALAYLQWVVADQGLDPEERAFVLQGADWLDGIARETDEGGFLDLDQAGREAVLRRVAQSPAGENWLSTLLLYIFEALLADPVYGANPDGIGWRWLGHQPGFPRPVPGKRYGELG